MNTPHTVLKSIEDFAAIFRARGDRARILASTNREAESVRLSFEEDAKALDEIAGQLRAILPMTGEDRARETEKCLGNRTATEVAAPGLDGEVIANKQLRRDLDVQLQKLKALSASREHALVITNLQQAIMWLGMDLKRLSCLRGDGDTTLTVRQRAEEAYNRYIAIVGAANSRGIPVLKFAETTTDIQAGWEAAVSFDNGRPYPSSYDPSNAKVEPTAEGLKL